MSNATITVLPGDGVGSEVTMQALQVLRAVESLFDHSFNFLQGSVGLDAIATEGVAISNSTIEMCSQSDAILFGAVGGFPAEQGRSGGPRPEQALFRLRKEFDLFVNLRPVRPSKAMYGASPLKPEHLKGTDMIFVRELSSGLYYGRLESTPGKPSEIRRTGSGAEAVDTLLYTDQEIERAVRTAFEIAFQRGGKVTSVDKANVLSSSILWREVVEQVARDQPTVDYEHMLVDTCAMELIRNPTNLDVIVTENLFGDILTDEASMLTGSIGMLPSASLGARCVKGGLFGLYEPVHGSAQDIAGKNKVNPIGAILSAALLLRHSMGLVREAAAVETAVEEVLREGYRTEDTHESGCRMIGTREMGDRICGTLKRC